MMKKFMMFLGDMETKAVRREAKRRGNINIQEVLRAVIIPEWLDHERKKTR
jgi:hypothetical protein